MIHTVKIEPTPFKRLYKIYKREKMFRENYKMICDEFSKQYENKLPEFDVHKSKNNFGNLDYLDVQF